MVACGNRISKILHTILTLLKSLVSKQGKSDILKVEVELPLSKEKSVREEIKKPTTKFQYLPKCPVMLKTSYNEQVAKREAEKMSKKNGAKLRGYKCQFCDFWHLTHKKNKVTMH